MSTDVDENPWRTGYKVVMRKPNCFRSPATICTAKIQSIIEDIFLRRAEIPHSVQDMQSPEEIPEVSGGNLNQSLRKFQILRLRRPWRVTLSCLDKFIMLVFRRKCFLGYRRDGDWLSFLKVTMHRVHQNTGHFVLLIRPENIWRG